MMRKVTLTIDLEDPTERYEREGRYVAMTRKILALCDEVNGRATFFTVGKLARTAPELIKDIAEQGHEIAYHSHAHVPLTQEEPERFRTQSRDDKDFMEQLTGKPVIGFRAPAFSLLRQTLWAVDILGDLGFRYSSSIMPTRLSRYGMPDASRTPFQWPNGLLEFPLPVANVGKLRVPYLGGIYLYALPSRLTRYWRQQVNAYEALWTYAHPYDFDRDEPFALMPSTPVWASLILRTARLVAEKKIRRVLSEGTLPPLVERMTEVICKRP